MKIYTKTGDNGTTMLFGGGRVFKHHLRIETYGTIDELNAYIGLLRDQTIEANHSNLLKHIQDILFVIGANLATNPEKKNAKPPAFQSDEVEALENAIDLMNENLPPLRHFILPGGHTTVSYCHLARCVCRRCERLCVALQQSEPVADIIIQYLNRLSDYLFVLSRQLASDLDIAEVIWQAPKQKN